MKISDLALLSIIMTFTPCASAIDDTPTDSDWEQAMAQATTTLVTQQESMDPATKKKVEVSEWPYEGVYRERGQIPPGYRVGGTAIVLRSLIEQPGWKKDDKRRQSIARGFQFLLDQSLLEPRMGVGFSGGYDVRDWGHIEALETTLRMLELDAIPSSSKATVQKFCQRLIDTLVTNEIKEGGWNYSRSRRANRASAASPFMTAPAVMALMRARDHGFKFDTAVIDRGLDTLEAARLETGAFQYSTNPDRVTGEGFEAVQGACARMAVCETALWLAGRADVDRVRSSIEAFLEHWEWLERRRAQTGTHNPPYYIAPYYFFYAHTHAARALNALPKKERKALRDRILARLWQVRGEDGMWNDRVFPRSASYGTAMTILAVRATDSPLPRKLKAIKNKEKSPKPATGTSL